MHKPLELGYGAFWNKQRHRTWSGTPLSLLDAFTRRTDVAVHDLQLTEGRCIRQYMRFRHLGFYNGKLVSRWRLDPTYRRWEHERLTSSLANYHSLDTVLTIGEHGTTTKPLFWYQDLSFVTMVGMLNNGLKTFQYDYYPRRTIEQAAEAQKHSMLHAKGIFTMSQWDREAHIALGIVDPDRIHVVGGGSNVLTNLPDVEAWQAPEPRSERLVLFIGREFERKGGDLVFEAVKLWRNGADYPVRLVIAGPKRWPLREPPPVWVTYLGEASYDALKPYLSRADVFAMPSRFEAYGIVFAEALASGVPTIGRRAFAMPEFINHGVNGFLVDDDDILTLAGYMEQASENMVIRRATVQGAADIAKRYSWDAVAESMMTVMHRTIA